MKKILKLLSCVAAVSLMAFSVTACSKSHVHVWGEWQRSETEHWRVCTSPKCNEEQRGEHEDYLCDECAAFKVLSLGFIEGGDEAHADFANEANAWFAKTGKEYGFIYDFTTDWGYLNDNVLANYELVMFLNNKPFATEQCEAFERYMNNGGAWMGFHVCAFSTNSSEQWPWYHREFLGSGNFRTNTWNPTSEILKVETHDHFSTAALPDTFESAPNEWYGWELDLRANPDITILLSLDESTFPAGDKPGEMWDSGDYPVAWTNNNYKMIYLNMGHNLMYYNTYEKQSFTFGNEIQNQFVLDGMFGLVNG